MHVFSIVVYAKTMLLTKTGFAVSLEQTTKKQRNDLGHQQNSFKKLIRDKKKSNQHPQLEIKMPSLHCSIELK